MIGSRAAAIVAAMIGSFWLCSVAAASPTRLGRVEFQAATADLAVVIDRLSALDEGVYPTAIPIANGVYSAAGPWVYAVDGSTRVLTDAVDPVSPRTFSGFQPGTQYWAADLGVEPDAVLRVTAIGVNETVAFDVAAAELGGFLAVGDRSGLVAVSVVALGDGETPANLVFANIATAIVQRTRDTGANAAVAISGPDPMPAPESPSEPDPAPQAMEPPARTVEPAREYVPQRAIATLVPARNEADATGAIEAQSDGSRVSLAITLGGMAGDGYELRVNGVTVAEVAPTASGTAALMLATDPESSGPVPRPLEFDPFASRYEIVHEGAVILTTTLGGVAVGGELVAIR